MGLLTVLSAGVDCRRGQSDVLTATYLDDTRAFELPCVVSMDPRAWSAEGVKECQDQLNHVVSLTLAADAGAFAEARRSVGGAHSRRVTCEDLFDCHMMDVKEQQTFIGGQRARGPEARGVAAEACLARPLTDDLTPLLGKVG